MGGRGGRSHLGGGGGGGGGGVGGPPPSNNNGTPKSLENFDATQQAYEATYFSGLTDAEKQYLREQFLKVFESNGFYMNIKAEDFEKVMNSWFMNQFEAKSSGGAMFDPSDLSPANERVQAAMKLFGVDWRSMKPGDYEKYGSMQSDDLLTAVQSGPLSYGEVMVRFKKQNLWDRTTYFLGDSLAPSWSGAVAGKVARGDFTGQDATWGFDTRAFLDRVRNAEKYVDNANEWLRHVGRGGYLELQYHGFLGMKDVESVVFSDKRRAPRGSGVPPRAIVDRLQDEFGVDVYYYDGRYMRKL